MSYLFILTLMAKKIAISMPEPMYKDMERSRKRHRRDRSAWVQEAIADRLRREKREADIAAYIRGYELYPETEEEIAFAEAAMRAFPWDEFDEPEEWPGAPR